LVAFLAYTSHDCDPSSTSGLKKEKALQAAMVLYATGFNAWGQLHFERPRDEDDREPEDISTFTCVLQDDDIDEIRPFFSYTRGA
jgi:hypothetical protein